MTPLRGIDLPELLIHFPNWVGWRLETRPGSNKPTKVPYSLKTKQRASSTNPADWCSFDEACQLLDDSYDGLGFVFTREVGIIGTDFDDCIDEAGNFAPWAQKDLEGFKSTYSEISPSGTGIKIFCRGVLPDTGMKIYVNAKGEPVKPGSPEAVGAVEMYDCGRFFTITGRNVGPAVIIDLQKHALSIYRRLRGRQRDEQKTAPATAEVVSEGGRHAMLLSNAAQWRNSGMTPEAILIGLRELNRRQCDPPKSEHELRGIVDWLGKKQPKYRLVPEDFERSRRVVNGEPQPAAATTPEEPADKGDALQQVDELLAVAIDGTVEELYGNSALLAALARAGDIKQHEAKRKLKNKFGREFSVKEWDARLHDAIGEYYRAFSAQNEFLVSATGAKKTNVANAIIMMKPLDIGYNAFTCRPFIRKETPWGTTGDWSDHDDIGATRWCQHQTLNIEKRIVADAAAFLAKDSSPWHPVREYLLELEWDGELRLETMLIDYFGVEDKPFARAVAVKWMISCIKRVMEPGCQADYTLVLEGGQGKRKSSALRALAVKDVWFTDDIGDPGHKDAAMQLRGKWIVELPELAAVHKKDIETVKAWLVRRIDHFRVPYGRHTADFPRQNVFAASTNKDEWMVDDTGGRRFWPVKVGRIDIDGLIDVRNQLWAEAFCRYGEGELSYFAEPMEAIAITEQHKRQDTDAWKDLVDAFVRAPVARGGFTLYSSAGHIYLPDVLWHCLGIDPKDWAASDKSRVTRILTLAGYTRSKAPPEEAEYDGRRLDYWSLPND